MLCTADCSVVNIGSKNVTTPPHASVIICIGEKSNRFLRNAITGTLKASSNSQIAENKPVSAPQFSMIIPAGDHAKTDLKKSITGAVTTVTLSQIAEKNPVTGSHSAASAASGRQSSTERNVAIALAPMFFTPSHIPVKNALIGVQLATIKPAATAMPMAISMIGLVLSTMLMTSITCVIPVTAVCMAEKAIAPAARPSTSFGLSASRLPTCVSIGSSPTTKAPTAGTSAASTAAETFCIDALNTFMFCVAAVGAAGRSTVFAVSLTSLNFPWNAAADLMPSTNGVITLPPLNRPLMSSLPRPVCSRLFLKLSTFMRRAPSLGESSSMPVISTGFGVFFSSSAITAPAASH